MKRFAAPLVSLVLAGGLFMAGCGKRGEEKPVGAAAPVVKGVVLESVKAGPVPDLLEAVGTVRARNAALIAARIPGTVTAVHVKEGDRVAKGKLLAVLEAVESTAGAASAQAGAEEARRGVEEARARKGLADATFERYRKLFAEQAVTRQEFETRQTERDVAAEGLARAESRLLQAREGARAAGTVAGYTRITSPLAGIVTGKEVDAGMTVFPGARLMTVEEEGNFRLEVAAPESLLGRVKPGDAVQVAIDGVPAGMKGRVAEVAPAVDPASRTFTVKVEVVGKGLRSGVYGRAWFPAGTRQGMLVPKSAVTERGSLTAVWVVGADNIARMRLVRTGAAAGERVDIISGLSDGERIVVGGVEKVVEGAKVE